jgi:threonine dehydratase
VQHQRAFTLRAAQNVDIELVLEARGHEHVALVLEALRGQGFEAQAV